MVRDVVPVFQWKEEKGVFLLQQTVLTIVHMVKNLNLSKLDVMGTTDKGQTTAKKLENVSMYASMITFSSRFGMN